MAFIGTPLDTRNTFQSLVGKRFNGDGSTTAFTLDVAPSSTLDIEVFVGNVRQDPNSAYTLSGTTLTFTGAPPSGTNNIYVVHQAKSVGTIDVPSSYKSEAQTISGARTHTGAITANAGITMGGTTPTLTIGDAGAEDTKIVFDGNAQDFHVGLDDSADDLVIGKGSALGTTTHMSFDENGHITQPLQSAFFAVLGTAQNNATGDSTAVNIGSWGTEVIDRNADFNASSGVFTAPVTGLYVIMSNGLIQGIATNHNDNQFKVISSNRTYDTLGEISSSSTGFNGSLNQSFCGVIDMDANDTVKLQIDFRSGSKVVDIHDGFKFSGYLLG
jgi:hypothetical protein